MNVQPSDVTVLCGGYGHEIISAIYYEIYLFSLSIWHHNCTDDTFKYKRLIFWYFNCMFSGKGTWLRYKKKEWELQKIALFQNKSMVRRATSKNMMSVWQYLNHKIMTKTDNKLIKFVSAFTIDNFFEGHHVSLHGQCL